MFDIDKAVATAAYITKRCGGKISTFILIKMMYAAEREALTRWHRPITGDAFFSMHKGPILSRVYDLIKGDVANTNSDMAKWSKHFSPRSGNYITLIVDADLDYLSEREREVIEIAMKEIETLIQTHGLIADVLHQKWPEWKDPEKFGRKSIPLSLEDVLMEVAEDDADVSVISSEIQAVQSAKAALQVSVG